MAITLDDTAKAMEELKQVKDLHDFQQYDMTAFCEKYNITQMQCNFLLSAEAVRRHEELNAKK